VAAPLTARCLISVALLLPLGCFLGMPFPLGVLALRGRPRSAVAWAWAANGLATVAGGLLCMVMALALGFRSGLLVGVALYLLAGVMLARLRRQGSEEPGEPEVEIGSEASKTLVGEGPAVYDAATVGL